ncbi:MAG: hypothetical protein PVI21_02760 [Candidatus Woesebacteria bacterium]|jgi:hypothetical protein
MRDLILEEYSFGANPGTKDLVRHMYTRTACGKVVIIADNPTALLSPLRKQWLKLMRKVQKEAAKTLNATRIYEFGQVVIRMQTLQFSYKWSADIYPADICLATPEQLLQWAPECRTLYVTCEIKREDLYVITALMPKGALVVMCKINSRS